MSDTLETTAAAEDAERRVAERVGDGPPLAVLGMSAQVHDVSRRGICLIAAELPAPGERLRLELRDMISRTSCALDGVVVWVRGDRAGLRWVDLQLWQDVWLLQRFELWLGRESG
ncbi:MAG: PilZ domain-containing protein [Armatimonadetes bacterium]|nr:PilZ domain-containing protein [Armatimonadota bacterium]